VVKEISAIANESVGIDPIKAAQQQVIGVDQVITDRRKMTCQLQNTLCQLLSLTDMVYVNTEQQ